MSSKRSDISRRGFLTASISGLVSAGLVGIAPQAVLAQADEKKKKSDGKIIYRKLGKTGMKVPIISLGVGGVGSPALVQSAYELGMRLFDTAANYANGRNEQMLGQVLHKLGVRDKSIIVSKIFVRPQRQGVDAVTLKAKALSLLEGSLRRLKTDYIDILMVHDIFSVEEMNQPGLLEAMQNLKKTGKVKAIGVSTHANMAVVLNEAARSGQWDVVLTSFNFTMADDAEMMSAIKAAADSGIGIIAMKTQAGGANWPNPESRQNYSSSTINKAVLRWVMNNPFVHTAVPGVNNFDYLKEDWEIATSLEYPEDEKKILGDNNIKLSMGFCRQCKTCLASCPNDADIPTLMRTHMYAKQYSDFYLARTTFDSIPKNQSLSTCSSCSECVAQCAHKSVDIASNIANLKLIYA